MPTNLRKKVVMLGTGGTISGKSASASDNVGYVSGQVAVDQLAACIPGIAQLPCDLVMEQVAQVDSKDMGFAIWQRLLQRCAHHLALPDVQGVVVIHGTDTMEETSYFLHTALAGTALLAKPLVLTGAMRPASSVAPDGPQNMTDAVVVATTPGMSGVVVVLAGAVHAAQHVQKVHPYRLDAFDSGDVGPLGFVEEGVVRHTRPIVAPSVHPSVEPATGPQGYPPGNTLEQLLHSDMAAWPRVEIIMNYAGAMGATVDCLVAEAAPPAGAARAVQGLVVACTGNGTVHHDLEAALLRAQSKGVAVVRASRCAYGVLVGTSVGPLSATAALSPVKARIALMLQLMQR